MKHRSIIMFNVYDIDDQNLCRYSLGNLSSKTLFVFGINPSTATNKKLDHTCKNIESFSKILNFDSFIILNLYPQRATDPKDIDEKINHRIHEKNLKYIKKYLNYNSTIWAAWGNLIDSRSFLKECLNDIYITTKHLKLNWIKYSELTKKHHPKHPARKKVINNFTNFDINDYLNHTNYNKYEIKAA